MGVVGPEDGDDDGTIEAGKGGGRGASDDGLEDGDVLAVPPAAAVNVHVGVLSRETCKVRLQVGVRELDQAMHIETVIHPLECAAHASRVPLIGAVT